MTGVCRLSEIERAPRIRECRLDIAARIDALPIEHTRIGLQLPIEHIHRGVGRVGLARTDARPHRLGWRVEPQPGERHAGCLRLDENAKPTQDAPLGLEGSPVRE